MLRLSREDKDLIFNLVVDALADDPAEREVFAITSEDLIEQAVSGNSPVGADSDSFFGGLPVSGGELLVHVLVAVAIDCAKHGFVFTRRAILESLKRRREARTSKIAEVIKAEEKLVIQLELTWGTDGEEVVPEVEPSGKK